MIGTLGDKILDLRTNKIPKRDGTFRTVTTATPQVMKYLSLRVPALNELCLSVDQGQIMHGFLPGRSPVTNAQKHTGFRFTLTVDIKNFFDELNFLASSAMSGTGRGDLAMNTLVFGVPLVSQCVIPTSMEIDNTEFQVCRQGLPASPAIANWLAYNIVDVSLTQLLRRRIEDWAYWGRGVSREFSYTRYADDLAISYNHVLHGQMFGLVKAFIEARSLKLSEKKTRLYDAEAGRRVICGVAIEGHRLYPTREVRRKMRAAQHAGNEGSYNGLQEWSLMKHPTLSRAKSTAAAKYRDLVEGFIKKPPRSVQEREQAMYVLEATEYFLRHRI